MSVPAHSNLFQQNKLAQISILLKAAGFVAEFQDNDSGSCLAKINSPYLNGRAVTYGIGANRRAALERAMERLRPGQPLGPSTVVLPVVSAESLASSVATSYLRSTRRTHLPLL